MIFVFARLCSLFDRINAWWSARLLFAVMNSFLLVFLIESFQSVNHIPNINIDLFVCVSMYVVIIIFIGDHRDQKQKEIFLEIKKKWWSSSSLTIDWPFVLLGLLCNQTFLIGKNKLYVPYGPYHHDRYHRPIAILIIIPLFDLQLSIQIYSCLNFQ